jgi:hypothetical protein
MAIDMLSFLFLILPSHEPDTCQIRNLSAEAGLVFAPQAQHSSPAISKSLRQIFIGCESAAESVAATAAAAKTMGRFEIF